MPAFAEDVEKFLRKVAGKQVRIAEHVEKFLKNVVGNDAPMSIERS